MIGDQIFNAVFVGNMGIQRIGVVIAIVISSIITLSVLVIFTRVKKCLSTKNNCNTNVKSKLRKFPTRLETKINSDMNKFENRKKVIYNDIDILDYELYLNDLKECI